MLACNQTSYGVWITAFVVESVILQIIGAIVNTLCLFCLWKCKRTNPSLKLQLGIVFSVKLFISGVLLPGDRWIKYLHFYCFDDMINDVVFAAISVTFYYTKVLERMIMSSVALYRFFAVRFPHLYTSITRVWIVVVLEIVICLYTSVPHLMIVSQGIKVVRIKNGTRVLEFRDIDGSIANVIKNIYAFNHLMPCVVTLVAYSLMIFTILRAKYKTSNAGKARDHMAFTIQVLILIDLLMGGTHAISHFTIRNMQIPMDIVHMIFYMQLVIDPLIFLLLNPRNRRILLKLVHSAVPSRMTGFLPPLSADSMSLNRNSTQLTRAGSSLKSQQGGNNIQLSTKPKYRYKEVTLTTP